MADEKKTPSVIVENLSILATPEGIQKYILGSKKNGTPRAVYDIVRDYTKLGKKKKKDKSKKKKKDKSSTSYEFYLNSKKGKKKKKLKKHWHI